MLLMHQKREYKLRQPDKYPQSPIFQERPEFFLVTNIDLFGSVVHRPQDLYYKPITISPMNHTSETGSTFFLAQIPEI
jgi:hypothetical protein